LYELHATRQQIKARIQEIEVLRLEFISSTRKYRKSGTTLTLEQVIYKIIHKQVVLKGFKKV